MSGRLAGASPGGLGRPLLRAATWNVHRWMGSDGRQDLERSLEVIGSLGAQVIALQEVCPELGGHCASFAEALAGRTGLRVIAGPTLRDQRGDYGNAVLTSLPALRVRRWDLSQPGREPRGALEVTLDADGSLVRLVASHLGLRAAERRSQLEFILERLGRRETDLEIILGDFNEWRPWAPLLRNLRRHFDPGPRLGTFPSRTPFLPLDRIWHRPASWRAEHRLGGEPALARAASDHLPLVADFHPPA
ncbi:MAG: endonuclease/exonuclease/phosphatase family protein [Desulfarculaceae bacterium]|nr:endonuclease/exonuclease/phosphatase family protein [Desulfarculaceae bacterium]MCF8048660.1 endonuclease/exonuclease/phosphatase family protein [Desulfarculaceae bacterium]MCF8066132.1 endonuclease/exonuclease/phosphatase family protein [Desulfarculaceae bacterium]MCF8099244.1 endonuclease/exonuclease/phosphatase family protein [Desulfarculaceae bacterium]